MTPTWLYTTDGRLLAYVLVQVPMPSMVTWEGSYFAWSEPHQRYEQISAWAESAGHPEGVPEAQPVRIDAAAPTDLGSMRYYLLDRIDALLNHPILIPLTSTDRAILEAQRRVYQTQDQAVQLVLTEFQKGSTAP